MQRKHKAWLRESAGSLGNLAAAAESSAPDSVNGRSFVMSSFPITELVRQHPVLSINLLFIAVAVLGVMLGYFLPPGPFFYGQSLELKLLSWDGRWYFDIAFNGYKWNPVEGVILGHIQNMAFFPLYPLIERLLVNLTDSINPFLFIVPGFIFGLLANLAFYRFSRTLLSVEQAWWATAFYALWPASCFIIMGYPTGLTNLLAILTLQNYLEGRKIQASLWCGLGSATAPTMVFVAAGLCAHRAYEWIRHDRRISQIPNMIFFGLLSVSGLILFMLYQFQAFHDFLAFQKAQLAWLRPDTLKDHVLTVINPIWYLLPGFFFLKLIWHNFIHHHHELPADIRNAFNTIFQYTIDEITFFSGVIYILINRRRSKYLALVFSGAALFLGYLWFCATTTNYFFSGIRLLYPAVIMFLLLGASAKISRPFVLSVFIIFEIIEVALVISGYTVI